MEKTVFSLETKNNMYFIDHKEGVNFPYSVHKNEKYIMGYRTFGEALEHIFSNQQNIHYKSDLK